MMQVGNAACSAHVLTLQARHQVCSVPDSCKANDLSLQMGDQGQIYSSVQPKEVANFIYQQTGQQIDESKITLPDIKKQGTYDGEAIMHPKVTASFKVQITRAPNK